MKSFKKIILGFLVLYCVFFDRGNVNLSVSAQSKVSEFDPKIEAKIDELHLELGRLISIEDEEFKNQENERILGELAELGVEIMTQEEINEKLPTHQRVSYPNSTSNVQWTSRRTNVQSNGVNYEVQLIHAVPKDPNSNMANTKSVALRTGTSQIKANAVYLVDITASAATSYIGGWGGKLLSLSQFSNGLITSSQTVSGVRANYFAEYATQMKFAYVKKAGTSDSNQHLSFTANMAFNDLQVGIPGFNCHNQGSAVCVPSISSETVFTYHPSSEWNNIYNNAIENFRKGTFSYSRVSTVSLKGVEKQTVVSFTPPLPSHMGQIY